MRGILILAQMSLFIIISICDVFSQENIAGGQTDDQTTMQKKEDETQFLEGLHYPYENFAEIYENLPRDKENKIDWERAIKEGLINPLPSIDENSSEEFIFDLRVVIKFNDMLIKDVVFSHAIHTYWLDCSSCHPKLFKPEISANKMTMKEIRAGKYCGKCHGMVAFPTNVTDTPNFRANCLRCHRAERR